MMGEFEDGALSSVIGIAAGPTIIGDEASSFLFSRHVVAVAELMASIAATLGWDARGAYALGIMHGIQGRASMEFGECNGNSGVWDGFVRYMNELRDTFEYQLLGICDRAVDCSGNVVGFEGKRAEVAARVGAESSLLRKFDNEVIELKNGLVWKAIAYRSPAYTLLLLRGVSEGVDM